MDSKPILIATRGSALALAQAQAVLDRCRGAYPQLSFRLRIIKTTGDKLQTASVAGLEGVLPKGMFTKELEVALLRGRADMAVHSLKDLPTDLPAGLVLGAVSRRADARDVLLYRDGEFLGAQQAGRLGSELTPGQRASRGFAPNTNIGEFPAGAVIGTSSSRRKAQLLAYRSDLRVIEIRGNVPTRLQRLCERADLDGLILAAAGLARLGIEIGADGRLRGETVPEGLLASVLGPELMLPCVGQGAVGIEIREDDERMVAICARLNHYDTRQCVLAERAFLRAMGGGCQSPVAAYADVVEEQIRLRAVSFRGPSVRRGEVRGDIREPEVLGERLAIELR